MYTKELEKTLIQKKFMILSATTNMNTDALNEKFVLNGVVF